MRSYSGNRVTNVDGYDMEVWQVVLYGSAAYLTLQLLMRLMETYRQRRLKELAEEYRQIQTRAATEQPATPAANLSDAQQVDQSRAA